MHQATFPATFPVSFSSAKSLLSIAGGIQFQFVDSSGKWSIAREADLDMAARNGVPIRAIVPVSIDKDH